MLSIAVVASVLGACTQHPPHPSVSPPGVATSSPVAPPSLIPTPVPTTRAIERSVRAFLRLLAEPTSRTSLEATYRATIGSIHDWIGWRLREPIAATAPGSVTVGRLDVRGAHGTIAWVDLDATIRYPSGPETVGGPVLMQRTTDGWKVLDYTWQGASQRSAIFPGATGSAQAGGVGVDVVGVVLQRASIDVFARITNATGDALDLQGSDTIITQDGAELVGVTPYADAPVPADGSGWLDFLELDERLLAGATAFRLELQIFTDPTFTTIDVDVPVTLR